MIKNLKIRTKLIVLSFVSLAIALFLGITSIFKLENTNEGLKEFITIGYFLWCN